MVDPKQILVIFLENFQKNKFQLYAKVTSEKKNPQLIFSTFIGLYDVAPYIFSYNLLETQL